MPTESEARRLAAADDPETSHLAAAEHVRSGRHAAQKAAVLDGVRRWPGSTARELAACIGLTQHVVARRLPDLESDGLVERGQARSCRIGFRPAVTWSACSVPGAYVAKRSRARIPPASERERFAEAIDAALSAGPDLRDCHRWALEQLRDWLRDA